MTMNARAFVIISACLAALILPGAAAQTLKLDFTKETVGAEPKAALESCST
jgi:hypothetical protein